MTISIEQSQRCLACGASEIYPFYQVQDIPVHSVMLLHDRKAALEYPRGDILLGFCEKCGFITNLLYNPKLQEYTSDQYESTQACSPTFNEFHKQLSAHLIETYDLQRKTIIEIGCGQGEFLKLLCEMGENVGIGFDPAFIQVSMMDKSHPQITFIKDYYSEKYSHFRSDFLCCKMTLEHIHNVGEFVATIRQSIGENIDTIVFFQVPDVQRILKTAAFWDIYYEHCSYFSLGSLSQLFQRVGFQVLDLRKDFDNQYLMLISKPRSVDAWQNSVVGEDVPGLRQDVYDFERSHRETFQQWMHNFQRWREVDNKVVVWGGGSKGVSFLTTLGLGLDAVEFVVDINPNKVSTYMVGTGQKIVSPDFLAIYKPDVVIIMNPIYKSEIQQSLHQMDLSPTILTV